MRTNIVTAIVISMFLFIISSANLFAGDTLTVSASGASLDAIINNDVSNGQQAHKVYLLTDVNLTYIYTGQISPLSDITIVGQLGADGRPPCIQPGLTGDNQIPSVLFNLTKNGTKFSLKNLYIEDYAVNGSRGSAMRDLFISGDNITVTANNVVFEGNNGYIMVYTGNNGKYFISNCKFRNGVDPVTWTSAAVLARAWPAVANLDSVSFTNCTFLGINAYLVVSVTTLNYFEFSHNNVVFTFIQPFFIFTAKSAKLNNNMFYSPFVAGELVSEYPWWDQLLTPEYPAVVNLDTLTAAMDSVYDPADYGKADYRWLVEAKRTIEVKNNVYYQPKAITDFWTNWNKTHTGGDSLYTPTWMDARTTNMFTDKTHWPGLVQSGNIMNQDPVYGSSFANVLNGGGEYGLGLLEYFNEIRGAKAPTMPWGYQIPAITSGSNWIPTWPLPETADMKYTNTALMTAATDGKPVGDLNWFGLTAVKGPQSVIANTFSLSAAYPNPFNPSTTVSFTLAKSGIVSLKVYNVMGQLVKTIVNNEFKNQGASTYRISMNDVPSGLYFYTLTQGNQSITKKMMLVK